MLKESFLGLKQETDTQELIKVKDYWDQTHHTEKRRRWRHIDCRNNIPLKTKAEELMKMVEQRKILVSGGQDQLRSGNNKEGTFNVKEAKGILQVRDPQVQDKKMAESLKAPRVDENQTLHVVGIP